MPAMVRAIPMCWTVRLWKRSAAWTIPAAAFSIRFSPDGGAAARTAGCRIGCGTHRCRAGLHHGRDTEGDALADSTRCDRQLPAVAALGGVARRGAVAAGGNDLVDPVVVRAVSALAGFGDNRASGAVCGGDGDQYPARARSYRLRLRGKLSAPDLELDLGGAQWPAGGAACSFAGDDRAHVRGACLERRRRGLEPFPALSAAQYSRRSAAGPCAQPPFRLKGLSPC